MKLLAKERCLSTEITFHLFDELFYRRLEAMTANSDYDFIKLGSYLDKHYCSPKRMTESSHFIFVVPGFSLIVVDVRRELLLVFSPSEGAPSPDIPMIRAFLQDYSEVFKPISDKEMKTNLSAW